MRKPLSLFILWFTVMLFQLSAQQVILSLESGSVRFAAIGDMGTGESPQCEVAQLFKGI